VLKVINSLHLDKAPGPDGFTTRFLQSTWAIIRANIMLAFDTFWHLDTRNLHSVNDAILTLLLKTLEAQHHQGFPINFLNTHHREAFLQGAC
jgi:hypothetical protein